MKSFSEVINDKRIEKGITLREFSLRTNIPVSKLSKILRGIQNPSNKSEFDEIVRILDISGKEKEALELLAMKEVFQEGELDLAKLPAFIKGDVSEEKLDSLLDLIKKSNNPE